MKTITVPFGRKHPIDVEYDRAGPYPVALRMPRNTVDREYPLSREEAVALRDALTVALEYDPTSYVQVKMQEHTRWYTYRDPAGTLAVGDFVQAPFGVHDRLRVGEVVALGKGGFVGRPIKDVAARLVTEPLV